MCCKVNLRWVSCDLVRCNCFDFWVIVSMEKKRPAIHAQTFAGCDCYVLTVKDEAHPRNRSACAQLEDLEMPYVVFKGVTPKDIVEKDYYSALGNRFLMKRKLSPGEIACYVSHRKIWQAFLDSGANFAMIFEDDFAFADKDALAENLGDCLAAPDGWDVIKFFDFNPKRIVRRRLLGRTTLVAYTYPASGNVGYLINRKAAAALLARKRFCRPADEDLSHYWEFGIRIWSVLPNPVCEISPSLGGSHLDAGREDSKRYKTVFRSIWGNVLQAWKLGNASYHRHVAKD